VDTLVRQTHDALALLYDPGRLQAHPLAKAFGGGRALRSALVEAVESLEPRRDGKPTGRGSRRFDLVRLRYLEGLPVDEVRSRLTIGHSEYYRELGRAVEAVAALLAERSGRAEESRARPPTSRLPIALTSLVGREDELAEIRRLLPSTRLLTLTGAGGCGKTRLALASAAEAAGEYPDGVYLVHLAPLADPALVPSAVVAAIGAREAPGRPVMETLLLALGSRRLLLVLDNCEHLVAACAQLTEVVLQSCAGPRVLATSREMLGIAGEVSFRVRPLPVPPTTADEVGEYASARLFVERAAAATPGFVLTEQNAPAVAEICRHLDGLPLALELAAARVRVLAVEQVAARLHDRFRLLTGGSRTALRHQQTLRASIAWSHDLLSESDRSLFCRLAVFADGWTLEAAEAVCVGDDVSLPEILDGLTSLVDKSLVQAESRGGSTRYRMLETIREYASEQLVQRSDTESLRGKHAAHYAALAEQAEPALLELNAPAWLDRLEQEHDNLRAALAWYDEMGQIEHSLGLTGALSLFWYLHGHVSEGRSRLDVVLACPGPPTVARARALFWAGWRSLWLPRVDHERMRRRCTESLEMARALDDQRTVARALVALGEAQVGHDLDMARRLLEEGLAIGRAAGDTWSVSASLLRLGVTSCHQGDYEAARRAFRQSLGFAREMGNLWTSGASLMWLGNIALEADGDWATASQLYDEAIATLREIGDHTGVARTQMSAGLLALEQQNTTGARRLLTDCLSVQRQVMDGGWLYRMLEGFGELAAGEGHFTRAARLFGAGQIQGEAVGVGPFLVGRAGRAEAISTTRARLGENGFAAAWAEGRAMTLEHSISYALAPSEEVDDRHEGLRRHSGRHDDGRR
jgi:predicted ATPase/Tfp pilus assembly protein PilF